MRVGFAGTPDFAVRALAALHARRHTIALVLTRPDRPSGRGLALTASPVKRFAQIHGMRVLQPVTLKDPAVQQSLIGTALDVLVVAAYGLILPREVLAWPRHGCLNIHASLLPRWRGAAPIARAIEAGDAVTGITIMQMDSGLDTGPTVVRREVSLGPRDTSGTLHATLAEVGAAAIAEVLALLTAEGRLVTIAQPASGASYAAKITRGDSRVDWAASPASIDRKIRALSPAPGAVAAWDGAAVKLWDALPLDAAMGAPQRNAAAAKARADGAPGSIVAVGPAGIDVTCGAGDQVGLLRLVELQPAAGKRMPAAAFAAGRGIAPGARFGSLDG